MSRKHQEKTDPNVERLRRGIMIGFGVALIALGSFGFLYIFGFIGGTTNDEQAYAVITGASKPAQGEPIRVTEFFSYGCIHCRDFEEDLSDWVQELPQDVKFKRSHVVFGNAQNRTLAQTYFALEALGVLAQNHERVFAELHDRGRLKISLEDLAELIDGNGTDAASFMRAANSPRVRKMIEQSEADERGLQIPATPTLVVADYFRINVGVTGRPGALRLADELIQRIRTGAIDQP